VLSATSYLSGQTGCTPTRLGYRSPSVRSLQLTELDRSGLSGATTHTHSTSGRPRSLPVSPLTSAWIAQLKVRMLINKVTLALAAKRSHQVDRQRNPNRARRSRSATFVLLPFAKCNRYPSYELTYSSGPWSTIEPGVQSPLPKLEGGPISPLQAAKIACSATTKFDGAPEARYKNA
jgi:hypothetical protein